MKEHAYSRLNDYYKTDWKIGQAIEVKMRDGMWHRGRVSRPRKSWLYVHVMIDGVRRSVMVHPTDWDYIRRVEPEVTP